MYLPDKVKIQYLDRDFLFSLIYAVDRNLYDKCVKISGREEEKKHSKTFSEYGVEITENWAKMLAYAPDLKGKGISLNFRVRS
jgi:hypothetical protein